MEGVFLKKDVFQNDKKYHKIFQCNAFKKN